MTAHTIERIVFLYYRKNFSVSEISYVLDVPESLVNVALYIEEQTILSLEKDCKTYAYTPKGVETESCNKSADTPH